MILLCKYLVFLEGQAWRQSCVLVRLFERRPIVVRSGEVLDDGGGVVVVVAGQVVPLPSHHLLEQVGVGLEHFFLNQHIS